SPQDLESAFEAANKGQARAVIVLSNPLTLAARTQIGDMAVKRRLPTMYLYRAHVDAGSLISYGPAGPTGYGSALGRVCGADLEWCQAGGTAGGATSQIRFGSQPEDREDPGPHDPAVAMRPRRPGDRLAVLDQRGRLLRAAVEFV